MPKFKVQSPSKHTAPETYTRIKSMLNDNPDFKKLDPKYNCVFNDAELTGLAKGSQFQAAMKIVVDGEACKVEIEVDLPLMLTPFKGMVEQTLTKKIAATLV